MATDSVSVQNRLREIERDNSACAEKGYDYSAAGVRAVAAAITAREDAEFLPKFVDLVSGKGHVFQVTVPKVSARRACEVHNSLDERYGSRGGYAEEQVTMAEIYAAAVFGKSVMRSAGCTILQQDAGVATLLPMVDVGTSTSTVVAPGVAGPGIDQTFSARIMPPLKHVAGPTKIPHELVRDGKNLYEMVIRTQALMIARGEGQLFTNGYANRKGILDLATVAETAGSSTAIAPDEVGSLVGGIESEYGDDPTAAFMMHRLIYNYLRKLKDSTGRYIFKGPWGTLWGKPVRFNRWMPSTIASGNKTILYGAWSAFCILDVNQPRISRWRDAVGVAENDLIAVQTHAEVDWALLNPSPSYPPIVSLQQP